MKTAVSIPDDVFEDAERLAGRLQTSRSQLYARALSEFVARHDDDRVTASMNQVVEEVGAEVDDFTRRASQQTLRRVEWVFGLGDEPARWWIPRAFWKVTLMKRAAVCLLVIFCLSSVAAAEPAKVLFIAGGPSHGYGAHEHYAGCRLLAQTLKDSGLSVDVVRGWPQEAKLLDEADSIVIYCDGGERHLALKHVEEIEELIDRGVGFVCIHYAVEVPKGEPGKLFLKWLGGCFEPDWSVNPHWTADFDKLPEHEITRGVEPFEAHDEWYFHMRFQPGMKGVTPILSAVPPESTMERRDGPHSGNPDVRKAVAAREPQHVAWAYDRPDGGRSFGITGGHYHWNWGRESYRRLMANAILWTAKVDVPEGGAGAPLLGMAVLEENQDEEPVESFDSEAIGREFGIR